MATRSELNQVVDATSPRRRASLHWLGVSCGLISGAWLGAAEAPIKLVNAGLSPYAISLCMVIGVFVARWTLPTLLKGTRYVFADLARRKHLMVWAVLAGALWAVANTLTIFAVRDVGLSVAFPLWNANALVGLVWARVLFGELKGAPRGVILRVVLGALTMVTAATLLGYGSMHAHHVASSHARQGIIAALGACVLWGSMYIPYRKAYISGMNPLSFVTIFTAGELVTVTAVALQFGGGAHLLANQLWHTRGLLFWVFLGGFLWVIGDLFQQFAAKYLGIGRGIPLTNTNQLWGLAWAALVFGELHGAGFGQIALVVGGSGAMILGAALISTGAASGREQDSNDQAVLRECRRYGLNYVNTLAALQGVETTEQVSTRCGWDFGIVAVALVFFIGFAVTAVAPSIAINRVWLGILSIILLFTLVAGCAHLRKLTRFS